MFFMYSVWMWLVCCIHAGSGQREQCKSSGCVTLVAGSSARPAATAVLELLCLLSVETGAAQCTAAR